MNPVGTQICKSGGAYVVIGHINCDRCRTIIELREVTHPSKDQRKAGRYYREYGICPKCGLYQPNYGSKTIIK